MRVKSHSHVDYLDQALSLQQQVGDRWGERSTRFSMAMAWKALDDLQRAEEEWKIVVELDAAIEHPDLASDRAALERVQAKRTEHEGLK